MSKFSRDAIERRGQEWARINAAALTPMRYVKGGPRAET